jgi:hypothetical protein
MADEHIRPIKRSITNRPKLGRADQAEPATTGGKTAKTNAHGHKDSFREIIETIVFVVVLVLLLKTFIAEAFVIPTGSMATTLLGYQKNLTCPQCAEQFTVNGKDEIVDQDNPQKQTIVECICPNCRFHFDPRKQ